ncbi:hypothetical protein A4A49_13388 [Nicotiana attenuata]|uniref:Uncharacterized protein n=1 Tax=Nicotiana attenuata TaxID=49451 RepID=A0A314LEZ6_NICAT|nr:hypothetical protein A4A49_13388 [Nicotiana attenuata]
MLYDCRNSISTQGSHHCLRNYSRETVEMRNLPEKKKRDDEEEKREIRMKLYVLIDEMNFVAYNTICTHYIVSKLIKLQQILSN